MRFLMDSHRSLSKLSIIDYLNYSLHIQGHHSTTDFYLVLRNFCESADSPDS